MTNWDKIVEGKELKNVKKLRNKQYTISKERSSALQELQEEGWEYFKDYKDKKWIGVRKEKSYDEIFEDKVWILFAEMGFTYMNSDRSFKIQYDYKNPDITQQIDVFAADDETVLIIECKAASEIKKGVFKKAIEAFYGQMDGLRKQVNSRFPGRKIKFIWATSNYIMNKADLEKLKEWNITYFSDATINYYTELVKHLGTCARYQLLGHLFANQEIKNMDNKIPAIQGKMGGHTYYSFAIEPEKLLKIGYVLHRSEANKNMMPTYQRLIKKKRLKEVQDFIEEGGYFPNSIIISIDTNGRRMQFDAAPKNFQVEGAISKLGILHLPKRYRAAYIIDGQHRLYGYSDTDFANKNTIPVVAFEELDREEQVQLFMDINENQKAVPRALRVTLNADLLWGSLDKNKQRQALRSKIVQMLGEEETSPLLGRVMVGEDEKSDIKCITVEAMQEALKQSYFFDVYDKANKIIRKGTFDFGDNQQNCDVLFPVLERSIAYVRENCLDEWNLGKEGILTINRGMQAVIRIIGDIVSLLSSKEVDMVNSTSDEIVEKIKFYLDPLCIFLNDIPLEIREELRSFVGAGANKKYWRTFQKAIADSREDFVPEGLKEYYRDEAKSYNHESQELLQETYLSVKRIIALELENKYGKDWFAKGLPIAIYKKAKNEADEKNYVLINKGDEQCVSHLPWEFVDLTACSEIVTTGSHWTEIFQEIFIKPEEEKIVSNKKAKTEWMRKLDAINKNLLRPTYSVPKEDYEFIKITNSWIKSLNI